MYATESHTIYMYGMLQQLETGYHFVTNVNIQYQIYICWAYDNIPTPTHSNSMNNNIRRDITRRPNKHISIDISAFNIHTQQYNGLLAVKLYIPSLSLTRTSGRPHTPTPQRCYMGQTTTTFTQTHFVLVMYIDYIYREIWYQSYVCCSIANYVWLSNE